MVKSKLIIVIIGILLGLNAVRWSGFFMAESNVDSQRLAADIVLQTPHFLCCHSSATDKTVVRDLFFSKQPLPPKAAPKPQKVAAPPPEPSGPTEAELALRAAEEEMSTIQLMGVLQQSGSYKAFVEKNGENYIVLAGDIFAQRYKVTQLGLADIEILDQQSQLTRLITLNE